MFMVGEPEPEAEFGVAFLDIEVRQHALDGRDRCSQAF